MPKQDHQDPHAAHLKEIKTKLNSITPDDLFTTDTESTIDSIIIELSILKYSGYSDSDDFTFIHHFHSLLTNTLLTILDSLN